MQSLKEVRKFIEANRKLEYNGYKNIKRYLYDFSDEELSFLESSFMLNKESSERLMAFKDIIPLSVAIYALIVSATPDAMKSELPIFYSLLTNIVIIAAMSLLLYLFLNRYPSGQIHTYRTGLEIMKQIRKEKSMKE